MTSKKTPMAPAERAYNEAMAQARRVRDEAMAKADRTATEREIDR